MIYVHYTYVHVHHKKFQKSTREIRAFPALPHSRGSYKGSKVSGISRKDTLCLWHTIGEPYLFPWSFFRALVISFLDPSEFNIVVTTVRGYVTCRKCIEQSICTNTYVWFKLESVQLKFDPRTINIFWTIIHRLYSWILYSRMQNDKQTLAGHSTDLAQFVHRSAIVETPCVKYSTSAWLELVINFQEAVR